MNSADSNFAAEVVALRSRLATDKSRGCNGHFKSRKRKFTRVSDIQYMLKNKGNKVAPQGRYFIAYGFNHRTKTSDNAITPYKGGIALDVCLHHDMSPLQGLNSFPIYNSMACAIGYEMSPLWGLNVNQRLGIIKKVITDAS